MQRDVGYGGAGQGDVFGLQVEGRPSHGGIGVDVELAGTGAGDRWRLAGRFTAEAVGSERECKPATPDLLERYGRYLTGQRSLSDNTRRIYLDDLHTFLGYCRPKGLGLSDMNRQMLRGYVAYLATEGRTDGERPKGYARVSIVRKLTALRTFYNFLVQEGWFKSTPVPSARSFPVKVEKPLPSFLGKKEATRLLDAPDDDTPTGLRDRAILEVLYACGVRLAEIEGMNLGDVYRERREILVRGKGNKERWTLFGEPAEAALDNYLSDGRPHLVAGVENERAAFREPVWRQVVASQHRKDREQLRGAGRPERRDTSAYAAAQLCEPHAGGRRRPAGDPGPAGTQQRIHYADVHPHHQAGSAAGVPEFPPDGGAGRREPRKRDGGRWSRSWYCTVLT